MTEILVEIKVVLNADHNELAGTRAYITNAEMNGQANEAVIDLLADHYNVKKNRVKVMKGHNSLQKTVKII